MLALIIVAGAAIRSYRLTTRSLWFDEAFSWRLILFPFQEMLNRAAVDVHPPLYYAVLRGWSEVFGTTLLSLRSFSVFFACLTMIAVYLLAVSAWRSRLAGLAASALVAVSGWQIAFAWEARMYTLGTFLAVFSSWLLLKAVQQDKQRIWWWLGYGLTAAAFAYTHYFSFFSIIGHAVFISLVLVLQTKWRVGEIIQSRMTWNALAAGALIILLFMPWLPVFQKQNAQVQASFWVPPIGGWSIPDTFYRMFYPTAGIPGHVGWQAVLAVLPIAGIGLLWLWLFLSKGTSYRTGSRASDPVCQANWLIALAGMVPFLMSIIVSFVGQSLYQDRFLVFGNIFILIGLAWLLIRLPGRRLSLMATALVIGLFLASFMRYWQELDIIHKPGAHATARQLAAQAGSGDAVIVGSPFVYFAIDHYCREELNCAVDPKIFSETGEFLHFAGGPIFVPDDFISGSDIADLDSRVAWVIDTTGFGGSMVPLGDKWTQEQQWSNPEVYAYQGEIILKKFVRD